MFVYIHINIYIYIYAWFRCQTAWCFSSFLQAFSTSSTSFLPSVASSFLPVSCLALPYKQQHKTAEPKSPTHLKTNKRQLVDNL